MEVHLLWTLGGHLSTGSDTSKVFGGTRLKQYQPRILPSIALSFNIGIVKTGT